MPPDSHPPDRVSGILVGMVREMTEVNRDLALQVSESRREHAEKMDLLRKIETKLDEDAKAEAERATVHSAAYKLVAKVAGMPGVPMATVALALWLAKLLGVISFMPATHGVTP